MLVPRRQVAAARVLAAALAFAAFGAPHAARAHDEAHVVQVAPSHGLAGERLAAPTVLPDRPDLQALLPVAVSKNQVAPMFVDAYEVPGKLLYRFDTVIWNAGGALDVYRDPASGNVIQVVWPGGTPSSQPDPNRPPSDPKAIHEDRTAFGASVVYAPQRGHDHWHFAAAARYELLVPGSPSRTMDKVGFCLFDTYGVAGKQTWFASQYTGSGPNSWCAKSDPDAGFVRMGISPSVGDYYYAQLADQWIDVTGLAPGQYTLKATVNPYGYLDETSTENNAVLEVRTIPGATAADVTRKVVGSQPTNVALAGTVVGPEIKARKSASCTPSDTSSDCYVTAAASGPLTFRIAEAPSHGTVTFVSQSGLSATALYTPTPGYSGPDAFTYTTTDARKLTSPSARVTVDVVQPPSNVLPPSVSGSAQDGQFLTADEGGWNGTQPLAFAYEWQRCDSQGSGCAPIPEASGKTYVAAFADIGSTLRVRVATTNAGGSASAISAPMGVVLPAPPAPAASPPGPVTDEVSATAADVLHQPGLAPARLTAPRAPLAQSAAASPRVKVLGMEVRRPPWRRPMKLVVLRYVVSGEAFGARERVWILRGERTVRSFETPARRRSTDGRHTFKWGVPLRLRLSSLTFCLSVRDGAGNQSPPRCARLGAF